MSKVQKTGFDPKAIDDAKVFSEIYIKLPSDKKAMVIAFMKGMEAAIGKRNETNCCPS